MKNPHLVTQALLVVVIAILAAGMWLHPAALPVPSVPVQPAASSTLADAARQYRDGLGVTFVELREAVKDGSILRKDQGVSSLAASRKPLADAMNAAFDAHCDESGKITDAAGLAAELDRAAQALGAK